MKLPAIVVFPVMNIGVIVVTAVVAYLIWKEEINLYGKIAIACWYCCDIVVEVVTIY